MINIVEKSDLGNTLKLDTKNKKIQVNTGSGISVSPEGVLSVESKLTPEKIEDLPVKYWKRGTRFIGNQNNEIVQIDTPENILQDVSVSLTADKQKFEVGEPNKVYVTVINISPEPTKPFTIIVYKPDLDNYIISNEKVDSVDVKGIVKNDELSYNVESLGASGVIEISFDITSNEALYAYQFSVQAQIQGLETNAFNNTDTIILNSIIPPKTNDNRFIVPGNDCTPIKASFIAPDNTEYPLVTHPDIWNIPVQEQGEFMNVINTHDFLEGHRFRFEGASTIVVSSNYLDVHTFSKPRKAGISKDGLPKSTGISFIYNRSEVFYSTLSSICHATAQSFIYSTNSYSDQEQLLVGDALNTIFYTHSEDEDLVRDSSNTFRSTPNTHPCQDGIIDAGVFDVNTGIFTLHQDLAEKNPNFERNNTIKYGALTFWIKPKGESCRWQYVTVIPTYKNENIGKYDKKEFDNVKVVKGQAKIDISDTLYDDDDRFSRVDDLSTVFLTRDHANWIYKPKPKDLDTYQYTRASAVKDIDEQLGRARKNRSFTVTANKGQEVVVEFDYYGGKDTIQQLPSKFTSTGKVTISDKPNSNKYQIIIKSNAKETDSINLGDIKVVIN